MADLTIVATEVLRDQDVALRNGRAGELITAGQAAYYDVDQGRFFKSSSVGSSQSAVVHGLAMNTASLNQTLRVQDDGAPTLGASAGIVPGALYQLSTTDGGICPMADAKIWQYRTFIGCGMTENRLALGIESTGIVPGSVLNTSLLKWLFASRITDDTPLVSPILDRLGYEEMTFLLAFGTQVDADATFTVSLEHGAVANLSDAAAVPDGDMISQAPPMPPEEAASWTSGDDAEVRKLGYIGLLRYLRMTITPALNTGNADILGLALLGYGARPVIQTAA